MSWFGNKTSMCFSFYPNKGSNELSYGRNILAFMQDKGNANFIEVGYNGTRIDPGTRFLFYTQDGLDSYDQLPNPTLVYTPAKYNSTPANTEDIPMLDDSGGGVTWPKDIKYGTIYKNDGTSSKFYLGSENKAIAIGENEPFLLEVYFKPDLGLTTHDIINIGYSQTAGPLYYGMKLSRSSIYNISFVYGQGTGTQGTLTASNVIPNVDPEFMHVAVLRTTDPQRLSLYINGEEADFTTANINIDQTQFYAGLSDATLFDSLLGEALFARIAVGEYTVADFSYSVYMKDYNGSAVSSPAYFEKDRNYSIYFDYEAGGRYKNIEIFNQRAEPLVDYPVEINTGYNTDDDLDRVFFEDTQGRSLAHVKIGDRHFVKVPYIASSGVTDIRCIVSDYEFTIGDHKDEVCNLYVDSTKLAPFDDFQDIFWEKYQSANSVFTNVSQEDGASGDLEITLRRDDVLNTSAILAYLKFNSQFVESTLADGYRLFTNTKRISAFNQSEDLESAMGVCLLVKNPEMDSHINFVTSFTNSTSDLDGYYIGGNFNSFNQFSFTGANTTNPGLSSNSQVDSYYKFTVKPNKTIDVYNYSNGASHTIDASGATELNYTNQFGLFFYERSDAAQLLFNTRWSAGPFYLLPYLEDEPIVTVGPEIYNSSSKARMYVNGEQKF